MAPAPCPVQFLRLRADSRPFRAKDAVGAGSEPCEHPKKNECDDGHRPRVLYHHVQPAGHECVLAHAQSQIGERFRAVVDGQPRCRFSGVPGEGHSTGQQEQHHLISRLHI